MTTDTTTRDEARGDKRAFTDKLGRTWRLSLDVGKARRVRDELHVDLLAHETENTILTLARNPIDLCAIVWILVEKQARTAAVELEDFWQGMTDDALEDATFAFLHALIAFFPTARQEALARIVRKMREVDDAKLEALKARLDSGAVDRKIEHALAQQIAELDAELAVDDETTTSTSGA